MEEAGDRLAALECLLFAAGDALSIENLAEYLEISRDQVKALAGELLDRYDRNGHGLTLLEVAGGYRMAARPEYYPYLSRLFLAHPPKLSRAALETLAVVCYRQPVTKADIEDIRGVQSDGVLSSLVEKGLIREVGRKEGPGRPILYGTTDKFLDHFGLRDLSELPPFPAE